jgi:hypothetical protein
MHCAYVLVESTVAWQQSGKCPRMTAFRYAMIYNKQPATAPAEVFTWHGKHFHQALDGSLRED